MFGSGGARVPSAVAAKEALATIAAGLDALAGVDVDALGDADLAESVEELCRAGHRLVGERCRVLRRFDVARVWEPSGARSAAAWVATRTRVAKATAAAELTLGRRLAAMGATEAALRDGDITVDAARRLARAATGRSGEAFGDAEEELVGHARRMRYADLDRVVSYWEQVVDPDGTDEAAQARHARRRVHCSELPDGTWRLDGDLDPIGGTILATELERRYQALLTDDLRRLRAEHGEHASLTLLERTPAQRRADALVDMALRSAAVPPGARKPRPLITVVVDYPTLAHRVLQTHNRTVIAPWDLARILTQSDIERAVFDAPSRVIDLGATRRFFTGATRRSVELRDLECTHPYCDEPYPRCQVDHTIPASRGGPTTQANGRLRCAPHNPELNGGRPTTPSPEGTPDHHDHDHDHDHDP